MSGTRRLDLSTDEVGRVLDVIERLCIGYADPAAPEFLERAAAEGRCLPVPFVDALRALRYSEASPTLVLGGFPVKCGPTPLHWHDRPSVVHEPADFWLTLVGSQLGDPVSWSSLQDGRLLNDIHPIRSQEGQQTGHGSTAPLELHVEDAFHEFRCDHLALLCLRNEKRVPTWIATIDEIDVSDSVYDVLFERRFLIRPDDEHLRNLTYAGTRHEELVETTVAVLYGSRAQPYLRLDPPYMSAVAGDQAAAHALDDVTRRLSQAVRDLVLSPGDIVLIDNQRALHGRPSFTPRYDGTDRWFRRMTTVRDLTKSRGCRRTPRDRMIDSTRALVAESPRPASRNASVS